VLLTALPAVAAEDLLAKEKPEAATGMWMPERGEEANAFHSTWFVNTATGQVYRCRDMAVPVCIEAQIISAEEAAKSAKQTSQKK
jgi:hypothetical protein